MWRKRGAGSEANEVWRPAVDALDGDSRPERQQWGTAGVVHQATRANCRTHGAPICLAAKVVAPRMYDGEFIVSGQPIAKPAPYFSANDLARRRL
jgi:hypothetical protein